MSQRDRQTNFLEECLSSVKAWKQIIEENLTDEEKISELNNLKEVTKDYCAIDYNSKNVMKIIDEISTQLENNTESLNVDDIYKEKLSEITADFNPEEHEIWREVLNDNGQADVEEVNQTRNSQSMTQYELTNDESIVCLKQVFKPPVDPISKTVIKQPYKNLNCGHIYEYKFVLHYIKKMKKKAKCPYIGCSNANLTVDGLVPDKETQKKIEQYLSQHSSQSNDDDED